MDVLDALDSRFSCRAFRPDPVPEPVVRDILRAASRAPSGGNLQPWHVHALAGDPLAQLVDDVRGRMTDMPRGEPGEYRVYPPELKEPYASRRFKAGEDLYATIEFAREDKAARGRQFRRNFELFGAPVGVFVYLDRTMGPPQWADCGMFLQSVMLAARAHGLHSCAQEAWAQWHSLVGEHLAPPPEHMLFCAIALGYMDEAAPVNRLRTERAAVDEFARFGGFAAGTEN
ncbi:nitroreductase [Stappia sp. ES.058]|uniref:nitroreductase n=1 Tax=Stappia sp. ES.058 TaxID=1881061 RepID=UPI00087D83FB|nr:nitroreductase [Stappia sp. ES.058]SDT99998.1 Nitroreductase [Stappia sp. ES.058]